ncbi:O-antigen ligase family protein [Alkalinema sp. FACHB-956]|uniref:O-antigen ligase family protein n=1 Tax=Alkalinema sp. FACHB-956 TaxID=2692768 RepID=UPI0016885F55|nr:O-antigen ligase family protein [Alkalinema sp. FACHB-956]MBD2329615.1 O-antigen ligase family protein [Alkalinema sp. FACHB-956]
MLTPLFARLVDYRSGWDPQRIILIAPYLITFIPLLSILSNIPKLNRMGATPLLLAGAGVLYATLIGLLRNPPFGVFRTMLDWLSPIVFALYYLQNWRYYPEYSKTIRQVFLWGVLITGVYGVYQYLVAPEWDALWLRESQLSSAGLPEPLKMRIWSTMHSPGAFAVFIMAGLLFLLTSSSPFAIPISGVGYLAILLSLVRTAWLGWGAGLLMLVTSLKPKFQARLLFSIVLIIMCAIPLVTMDPFAETINTRIETLTDPQDNSLTGRMEIYDTGLFSALLNPVGNGLGSSWIEQNGKIISLVVDSGFIDLFLSLGWIGAIPYLIGLLISLLSAAKIKQRWVADSFLSTGFAISVIGCLQMWVTTTLTSLSGIAAWSFLGLILAGEHYYKSKMRSAQLISDVPLASIHSSP